MSVLQYKIVWWWRQSPVPIIRRIHEYAKSVHLVTGTTGVSIAVSCRGLLGLGWARQHVICTYRTPSSSIRSEHRSLLPMIIRSWLGSAACILAHGVPQAQEPPLRHVVC